MMFKIRLTVSLGFGDERPEDAWEEVWEDGRGGCEKLIDAYNIRGNQLQST